jgi:hypothetical protein
MSDFLSRLYTTFQPSFIENHIGLSIGFYWKERSVTKMYYEGGEEEIVNPAYIGFSIIILNFYLNMNIGCR